MSAPAYFISRGYGSPMHLDKTASCFPEAMLCAEIEFHRVDLHAIDALNLRAGHPLGQGQAQLRLAVRRADGFGRLLAQPRVALLLPPAGRRRPPRDAAHAGPRPRRRRPRRGLAGPPLVGQGAGRGEQALGLIFSKDYYVASPRESIRVFLVSYRTLACLIFWGRVLSTFWPGATRGPSAVNADAIASIGCAVRLPAAADDP